MNDILYIALATANRGKMAELSGPLSALDIQIHSLDEFPHIGEIVENGATFAENALIKARTVAKATGLISIADDSGLMVDALAGAPGVFSARYAEDWPFLPGENRDARNIRKLLYEMRHIPPKERTAHFVTVMAAAKPDGQAITARGEWPGQILDKPRGSNGFGYDPVFYDPALGKAAAELSRDEKNARSHRGKAVAALLKKLPAFMGKQ